MLSALLWPVKAMICLASLPELSKLVMQVARMQWFVYVWLNPASSLMVFINFSRNFFPITCASYQTSPLGLKENALLSRWNNSFSAGFSFDKYSLNDFTGQLGNPVACMIPPSWSGSLAAPREFFLSSSDDWITYSTPFSSVRTFAKPHFFNWTHWAWKALLLWVKCPSLTISICRTSFSHQFPLDSISDSPKCGLLVQIAILLPKFEIKLLQDCIEFIRCHSCNVKSDARHCTICSQGSHAMAVALWVFAAFFSWRMRCSSASVTVENLSAIGYREAKLSQTCFRFSSAVGQCSFVFLLILNVIVLIRLEVEWFLSIYGMKSNETLTS